MDVSGPDRGLCVPTGREWQDRIVPHAFHHQEPTLAATTGELRVYQPFEGEGAS